MNRPNDINQSEKSIQIDFVYAGKMAAPLWIISGILLCSLAHAMASADVDNKDRTSEEYVEYQKTSSESETLSEIPNTDDLVNGVNRDTVKEANLDSTNPETENSDNGFKESNSEKSERTFSPEDNENSASVIKESTQSKGDSLEEKKEEIVQDQSKVVQDQKEDSNDKTGEEMKELDANVDTTNESYHEYLSFGNILKSIVDPVLESSSEVLADMPTLDNNASSLNLTQVMENATLDKSLEEDELTNKTDKKVRFQCSGRNFTEENITDYTVKIVNNTGLLNALNFDKNESVSDCVLVLFFAPWCPFCAKMAPNYNALARAFPQLEVLAVDAAQFSNLNARFGTVLVPNILLFHQSRALVRFNQTDKSFDNLASFVRNITGLEPDSSVNVTEKDYEGPLSSIPTEETDYLLWVAWLFVLIFTGIVFVQSTYGQQCITKVRILWQEHQHID